MTGMRNLSFYVLFRKPNFRQGLFYLNPVYYNHAREDFLNNIQRKRE